MRDLGLVLVSVSLVACAASTLKQDSAAWSGLYRGGDASLSLAADHAMLVVEAGQFIAGSTLEERQQAYADYLRTAGDDTARNEQWFEMEAERHVSKLPSFRIDQQPVTNAAYAEFVRDTRATPPFVDKASWQTQGSDDDDDDAHVQRFGWQGDDPPSGREDHPAVLMTWQEASAYCAWRGALVKQARRLPSADEFEKAARGPSGRVYPWGQSFDADKLNSRVTGPVDTVSVGSFPSGASVYNVLDTAGNIRQWTSTAWPHQQGWMTVKGSTWADYAGVGRGACRQGHRPETRHVLVGFRCAADM